MDLVGLELAEVCVGQGGGATVCSSVKELLALAQDQFGHHLFPQTFRSSRESRGYRRHGWRVTRKSGLVT